MSRPGCNHHKDTIYAIANLASLFTVCAMAVSDIDDWSDDVRKGVTQDIKSVLELGAILADEAAVLAERQIRSAHREDGQC